MQLLKCYQILVIVPFLLNACSKLDHAKKLSGREKKREHLNQVLRFSKTIPYKEDELSQSLSLSDTDVVRKTTAKTSGETTSISFNTDLMKKFPMSEIERHSLQFIEKRQIELMVDASELVPDQSFLTSANGKIMTVRYGRKVDGLEVKDAYISLVYAIVDPNAGDNSAIVLRDIKNRSYGRLDIVNTKGPMPSPSDLEKLIGLEEYEIVSSKDVLFPEVKDDAFIFYRAREFTLRPHNSREVLTLTISARDFKIIEAYSDRLKVRHQLVSLTYDSVLPEAEQSEVPLSFFKLESPEVAADGDGFLDIPENSDSSKISFTNARIDLRNHAGGENFQSLEQLTMQGLVDGEKIVFSPANEQEEGALAAVRSIQKIERLARRHLTTEQASILKDVTYVAINDQYSICNPYFAFNVDTLYLGPEGEFQFGDTEADTMYCPAMALLPDIVTHEWCHGLDVKTGQFGIHDRAFSEAMSDICASFADNDPLIGENFSFEDPEPVRNIKNNAVYPNTVKPADPYETGSVLSGSFWDLRIAMIERYGYRSGAFKSEELFFKHLVDTNAYLDSYANLIILDDDDGNPATQSANFCLINAAFAKHGLASLVENCVERKRPDLKIPVNDDLQVGLDRDLQDQQLKWVASAEKTAKVELCFSDPEACILGEANKVRLNYLGVKEGRNFFASSLVAEPVGMSRITVIATGYYGDRSYHAYATGDK